MTGWASRSRIYEQIPHSSSYWYAKQRNICGLKTLSCHSEYLYDSKGELTRTRLVRRPIANEDPRTQNKTFLGAEDTVPDTQLDDWQSCWVSIESQRHGKLPGGYGSPGQTPVCSQLSVRSACPAP